MEPHFYFRFEFDPESINYTEYTSNAYAWHQFNLVDRSPVTLDLQTGNLNSLFLFNLHHDIIIIGEQNRSQVKHRQFVNLHNASSYSIKMEGLGVILFIAAPFNSIPTQTADLTQDLQSYHIPVEVYRIIKGIFKSKVSSAVLDLKIQSSIAEIADHLQESINSANFFKETGLSSTEKAKLVLAYILDNITDPNLGGLNEFASRFYLNRNSLSKAFYSLTSITIPAFIRLKRVELACNLLLTTNMLINDIAEETGFTDTANFIRCFRSILHTTPRRYRLTHKDNHT